MRVPYSVIPRAFLCAALQLGPGWLRVLAAPTAESAPPVARQSHTASAAGGAAPPHNPAPPTGPRREIKPLYPVTRKPPLPDSRACFEEIFKLIQDNYYTDAVDRQSLYWAAIQGMLRWISPPEKPDLAQIWTPEQYARIAENLEGIRESIGITSSFNPNDGSLTVKDVCPDGPASSLLRPYDRIVRIDGKPLKGRSVREIDDMLRGPPGSRVVLKVVRDIAVFDVTVPRAEVRISPCTVTRLPGDILLAYIPRFAKGVSKDLRKAFAADDAPKPVGVIIDVRGDGGGVFGESLRCAEIFIPKPKPILCVVSHGSRIQTYVSNNVRPFRIPLAVIIDRRSASASEILAAALRDSAGAVLFGEHSFGKASMEKTFTLKNKYRVHFTIGALYSPLGRSWQKTGITPDIPVAAPREDPRALAKLPVAERLRLDAPLRAAWSFLRDTESKVK